MRRNRPAYLLALLTVGFLGIYWAAGHAQERPPLFAPPPVLPVDPPEPAKAPAPKPAAKAANPSKSADPTLIIPAAVFEEPRSIQGKTEPYSIVVEVPTQIVQTGGVQPALPAQVGTGPQGLPAPMFPSLPLPPSVVEKKAPEILPPLPPPLPEPTKALIVEPPAKEAPRIVPLKGTLPAVDKVAPPIGAPEVREPAVVAPVQPSPEKPKGFVRIRTEPSEQPAAAMLAPLTIPPMPTPLAEIRTAEPVLKLAPPPLSEIRTVEPIATLPPPPGDQPIVIASSVQTPSVTVEKRGPTAPRMGETVSYQLMVRNQGAMAAQQIRIEDELAADARFITAEPMPIMNGNKVVWTLSALPANQVQVLRMTVQAGAAATNGHRTTVQVSATNHATNVNVQRPASLTPALAMELIAPKQLAVGKPAVFEIRVVNHSEQPVTGLMLHGALPAGLNTPEGRTIEGEVGGTLQPGETKTLRMPTNVVQAGRFTVEARVTTQTGQAVSASTPIEIGAESLQISQAATRIFVGRDGDLRIDVTNATSQVLRHVAVSNRLPEGLDYVMASERGLYQANSRTVHWLIDQLAVGATQTLHLRLYGAKPGNYQNTIAAKADGGVLAQSTGTIAVQAVADVSLRVIDKDRVLEVGRETSYEIQLENPGHASLKNVRVRVEFPPGMTPKDVQANSTYTQDRQSVVFEPIAALQPQEKAIYRVSAVAQATGDQRVRFAVVSDQVPTPIVREISTLAYRD